MALFRSDILNHDFFKSALCEAERTGSVDLLEVTVGEAEQCGLQEIRPVLILAAIRGREKSFHWVAKLSSGSEAASRLGRERGDWERG